MRHKQQREREFEIERQRQLERHAIGCGTTEGSGRAVG